MDRGCDGGRQLQEISDVKSDAASASDGGLSDVFMDDVTCRSAMARAETPGMASTPARRSAQVGHRASSEGAALPHHCRLGHCTTVGMCFKSMVKKEDHVRIAYRYRMHFFAPRTRGLRSRFHTVRTVFRCLDDELLEPKERPFICHASQAQAHLYSVGCCDDGNGCNGNLTLPFSDKISGNLQSSRARNYGADLCIGN